MVTKIKINKGNIQQKPALASTNNDSSSTKAIISKLADSVKALTTTIEQKAERLNGAFDRVPSNVLLSAATGGFINPVISKSLGLDNLIIGIGKTITGGINKSLNILKPKTEDKSSSVTDANTSIINRLDTIIGILRKNTKVSENAVIPEKEKTSFLSKLLPLLKSVGLGLLGGLGGALLGKIGSNVLNNLGIFGGETLGKFFSDGLPGFLAGYLATGSLKGGLLGAGLSLSLGLLKDFVSDVKSAFDGDLETPSLGDYGDAALRGAVAGSLIGGYGSKNKKMFSWRGMLVGAAFGLIGTAITNKINEFSQVLNGKVLEDTTDATGLLATAIGGAAIGFAVTKSLSGILIGALIGAGTHSFTEILLETQSRLNAAKNGTYVEPSSIAGIPMNIFRGMMLGAMVGLPFHLPGIIAGAVIGAGGAWIYDLVMDSKIRKALGEKLIEENVGDSNPVLNELDTKLTQVEQANVNLQNTVRAKGDKNVNRADIIALSKLQSEQKKLKNLQNDIYESVGLTVSVDTNKDNIFTPQELLAFRETRNWFSGDRKYARYFEDLASLNRNFTLNDIVKYYPLWESLDDNLLILNNAKALKEQISLQSMNLSDNVDYTSAEMAALVSKYLNENTTQLMNNQQDNMKTFMNSVNSANKAVVLNQSPIPNSTYAIGAEANMLNSTM